MDNALRPEENDFKQQLNGVQAVVFVRYFGFEGHIAELSAEAQRQGCLVIEDLAHAAFPGDLYGDYGVTSLVKFYATDDGAEIFVHKNRDSRAIETLIGKYQQRFPTWPLRYAATKIRRKISPSIKVALRHEPHFRYFDTLGLWTPKSFKHINNINHQNHNEIIDRRRANYLRIDEMLNDSTLGTPLYPRLEKNVTPYVYPFLLHKNIDFQLIRSAGIPLFRWEELANTACTVSAKYRSHLIQVPCHQDLTESDFAAISDVFTTSKARSVGH